MRIVALHHATSGEVIDLSLRPISAETEHSTAIVKTDQFEAIRLVIPRGTDMPQHQVPGSITLHCLEGRVQLGLGETVAELGAHQWVYLEGGAAHSVKGVEDSVLLLTILFPPADASIG
ncbi:cupin domain-containing protein [Sphingobium cloacae]|nr:cupin domain-containing protein [Sphingobium cloacae]